MEQEEYGGDTGWDFYNTGWDFYDPNYEIPSQPEGSFSPQNEKKASDLVVDASLLLLKETKQTGEVLKPEIDVTIPEGLSSAQNEPSDFVVFFDEPEGLFSAQNEKEASDLVVDASLLLFEETKQTGDGLGSMISDYKVSDIYQRYGQNKSFLTPMGETLLEKIYKYISDKKFNVDELNLLDKRQLNFLIRLFGINTHLEKKSELINLILNHLLNIEVGALGKRETSGTLPRNTKKKKTHIETSRSQITTIPQVDIVGNELKFYIDNLTGNPLLKKFYTKDNLAGNPLLKPYKLTKYGNELYKKVEYIFTKYKLSSNEIINVLSNLDMKSTYKIYQVIYKDLPHYTQKIMNQQLIPQLAQELSIKF